jgi:tetratricopeptide (TPR) repeat protein
MADHLHGRFDTIKWKDGGKPTPEDVLRLAGLAKGQFTWVDEVVSIIRDLPPSNYQDISQPISTMAFSIWEGSKKTGSTEELEHSILLQRVALALRPPGHPLRHWSLNNLSAALDSRYRKTKSTEDLEECILLFKDALALRQKGHPDRHYSCYNLAGSLHNRFLKGGLVGDLDEAITLGREALSLRPEGHPRRFTAVNNQKLYLYNSFKKKGAVEDLREAIGLAEEALSICPKDHHKYATLPGSILSYKSELARARALSGDTDSDEP